MLVACQKLGVHPFSYTFPPQVILVQKFDVNFVFHFDSSKYICGVFVRSSLFVLAMAA